jgi:hypothetical protein
VLAVVQVTLAPLEVEQFQPVPLGVALKVSPVGNVSVTVIAPVVGAIPVSRSVSVYCAPLWPIVHAPLSADEIANTGRPKIVVRSTALVAALPALVCVESPPP